MSGQSGDSAHPYGGTGSLAWVSECQRIEDPGSQRVLLVLPQARKWTVLDGEVVRGIDSMLSQPPASAGEPDRLMPVLDTLRQARFLGTGKDGLDDLREDSQVDRPKLDRGTEAELHEVMVVVTTECDLRCLGCSAPAEAFHGPSRMPLDVARQVVRSTLADPTWSRPHITISGGEPCLHPEYPEFLNIMRPACAKLGVNTNGALIEHPGFTELTAELADVVAVSIDGASAEVHDRYRGRGSFRRAMATVARLKEHGGCKVTIRSIDYQEMADGKPLFDYGKMRQLAESLECELWVNGLLPLGRGRTWRPAEPVPQANAVERELQWFRTIGRALSVDPVALMRGVQQRIGPVPLPTVGCGGGVRSLDVTPDGSIGPCIEYKVERGDAMCFGNVTDEGCLSEIMGRSETYRAYLNRQDHSECGDCFARHLCAWPYGCRLLFNRDLCHQERDRLGRLLWRFDPLASFEDNLQNMFADVL